MWQRRAKFLNERLENDYDSEQRGMIRAAFNLDNLLGGSVIICLTHCQYPVQFRYFTHISFVKCGFSEILSPVSYTRLSIQYHVRLSV